MPRHKTSMSTKKPKLSLVDGDTSVDLSKVRAYAACRSCRQKKVKCKPGPSLANLDGNTTPGPCQQCTAANIECTYPPTRDRAAYSRQYVQNLEGRVQALEQIHGRMVPVIEAFEKGQGVDQPLPLPSLNGHMGKVEPEDSSYDEAGPSAPPSPDAGQITQDDRGNYRWIGSSNTLSLLDSFQARGSPHERGTPETGSHDNPYFGPVAGAGVVKALPGVDEVVYPRPDVAKSMVDAFFRDVHPVLPVVLEHEFRSGYKALMERRARGEPEQPGGFVSVVFAIFALGERVLVTSQAWQRERDHQNDEKRESVLPGEAEAGVIWYERAQILHYTTLKDVNIQQVQCLTLMAAFQASVNAMPMSWLLAGQAIRVAQDLGLHRSTARGIPFAEKQMRSRCWWSIYGLERLVSVTLGRPLGVDDLDIDVALPSPINDDQLRRTSKDSGSTPEEPEDTTMSGFVALTKLCKIAGRVAQLLYRPSNGRSISDPSWAASQQSTINKLDKLLKDWLESDVPPKYKDPSLTTSRTVQLVSAILSNAYFTVLLALHRNFLPSNPAYPRPRPPSNSQSLSHLVETARSVIHVASQQRVLLPPSHHLSAYCHNLWSSAVILLLCEVQARDQVVIDAVGSSVESCRQTLQALEPAWPGSRKLKELLNEAEVRAKEVALGPGDRPKKRKNQSSPMAPPQRQHPTTGTVDPRRAYETSNTRTPFREDEMRYYNPTIPLPPPPGTFDTSLFDVGGVTFDGLEMLQGFNTNTDATQFWNSFISPTGQANYVISGQTTPNSSGPSPKAWQVNQGNQANQGNQITQTPNSVAISPGGLMSGSGADFWSQLAPGGFDWGADPNVPFNI